MNKIGKLKIVISRGRDYLSLAQFGMVSWLFSEKVQWNWWWGLGVVIFGLFMWYDYRKILPSEYSAGMELNPRWRELEKSVNSRTSFVDAYNTVQK